MCNMMMGQGHSSSNDVCAICGNVGHTTNVCPSGKKKKGQQSSAPMQNEEIEDPYVPPKPYVSPVPFLGHLIKSKWDKSFSDIYDIFSKVNVNLPLLDMIRNMPAYLKFFKELNTCKCKYEPHKKVMISETGETKDKQELALIAGDGELSDNKAREYVAELDSEIRDMSDEELRMAIKHVNVKLVSSIKSPLKLNLKPLPPPLKYAYLGKDQTLLVIIALDLTISEKEKLLRALSGHQAAIGWTIADIKGISPTMCMHKVLLEEDSKPTSEVQRRLNSHLQEVVGVKVLKLLDVGIIYLILDSKWVSPVHVVLEKLGITMVRNSDDGLVLTSMIIGWRFCIDYRKLNATTKKDHFPLPFIDQMLEKLAGYSYYCFLDGFLGYNKILIALEDQEKTTFTFLFGTFAYRRMPFRLCKCSIHVSKMYDVHFF
ncbi:uncharacterized protein LOC116111316 [Pistacia vera]|uniref:uncharacterized protein LOC116111316 n=1 Tax=Pistacia vera TaxID=55513 RepID=UPI0012634E8A|nr:uncharacterized protein LOC116111316 [Pistacia vera]